MIVKEPRPLRAADSTLARRKGAARPNKREPARGARSGVAALFPAKRGWRAGVTGGAMVSAVLLAVIAANPQKGSSSLPRLGGGARGIAFAAADPVSEPEPLWSLSELGPYGDAQATNLPARNAQTDSGGALSSGAIAAESRKRAGAAVAARDGREHDEMVAEASSKRGSSAAHGGQGVSPRASRPGPATKEVARAGARTAEVRRRTSVAVSLEEEKSSQASLPKARVKVKDPVSVVRPPPPYPADALKSEQEGLVRVNLLVSSSGTVDRVEITESQPPGVFDQSVQETLKQWRFTPARDKEGKPMESWEMDTYEFSFKLQRTRS